MGKPEGERFPNAAEADTISKLSNAIKKLETEVGLADIISVFSDLLKWVDGTAKGGIAIAIQAELGVPVKYIGIGEKIEDLQKFDTDSFVDALFTPAEEKFRIWLP